MKITILGCYSATPRTITNPTSQVVELSNQMFLVDCGEGTQVQIRRKKIKFSRIQRVFISHLHGDHFFGLIGLISTFSLLNRQDELHIYGPKGIKNVILLQIKLSQSYTSYPLYFHELESTESELIFENEKVEVYTIPLKHRVYTNGYLFKEKNKKRKLNIAAVEEYGIDIAYYQKIKNGGDIILENGEVISNEKLTLPSDEPQSYAFCSDTQYLESIVPIIKNVDVLYHESTFLEQDQSKTVHTMHSTAKEAATIALKANAKYLILGHYSTRYKDLQPFKDEAETIFPSVFLAEDGKEFNF